MVILIEKIKGYLTIVILSCVLMHFLEQKKGLGHTPRDHSLVVCHVCPNRLTYKVLFSSIIL